MTSAPLSVSCSWHTSTSAGSIPATSNAARAASALTLVGRPDSIRGLNTSNDPGGRVRTATERNATGGPDISRAAAAEHSTRAAAPSPGEQNMYRVSGSLTSPEPRISAASNGVRRHASGFRLPLRYAFSARPVVSSA